MAALPIWGDCWSAYNLQSFQIWFAHYATEAEQESVLDLYVIEHFKEDPVLFGVRLPTESVPVTLSFRGAHVQLPRRACSQADCRRCSQGHGGYQFRWIDSRWTPRAALDLTLNPRTAMQAMDSPWPRGLRSIPKVSASSSSFARASTPETERIRRGRSAMSSSSSSDQGPKVWLVRGTREPMVRP